MEHAFYTHSNQFWQQKMKLNLEKLIVTIIKLVVRWGRSEARHRNGLQIKYKGKYRRNPWIRGSNNIF